MQFADVIKSLHRHWKVSAAIIVLTIVGVGIYLFNRNGPRPPDRWQQDVQILVPVRDKDGNNPEGVPPSLLQGQAQVRPRSCNHEHALERGPRPGRPEPGHVRVLAAPPQAMKVAAATSSSPAPPHPTAPRRSAWPTGSPTRTSTPTAPRSQRGTGAGRPLPGPRWSDSNARLVEVKQALSATNPELLALVNSRPDDAAVTGDEPTALTLPDGLSLETGLLVYEGRALSEKMDAARLDYADAATTAIVPSDYTTIVERPYPIQITPGLSSPVNTVATALAIGLLLALAVPVLMDRLDHSIRNARTASNTLSAPVLTTIPATSASELATLALPGTPQRQRLPGARRQECRHRPLPAPSSSPRRSARCRTASRRTSRLPWPASGCGSRWWPPTTARGGTSTRTAPPPCPISSP